MSYLSTTDPKFSGVLESWFCSHSELLALIRFSHSAGSRTFEFYSHFQALLSRMEGLPPSACVTVFRDPQLPLRGVVDDAFIAYCLEAIPHQTEFLIVEMTPRVYGPVSYLHNAAGESLAELREELSERQGTSVAVGLYPPWLYDTGAVTSAVVPDEKGIVTTGVY